MDTKKKKNSKKGEHEEGKSEEFLRFEDAMKTLLSVPPDEVKRLKEEGRKERQKKSGK